MKIKGYVIFGTILVVVGACFVGFSAARPDFNVKKYAKENLKFEEITKATDEIDKIAISVNADKVTIIEENRSDIYIQNKILDNLTYDISVVNNVLLIDQRENTKWYENIFAFGFHKMHAFSTEPLVIKIPNSKTFDYDISINAGTLKANDIKADHFVTEVNAGTVDFDLCVADSMQIEVNAGTLSFYNSQVNRINAEVNAGTLKYGGAIANSGIFEVNAGSIYLNFTDKEENYTINGNGSGPSIITSDCSAGSIKYTFNN